MSKISPSLSDVGFYGHPDPHGATLQAFAEILAVLPKRDKWCVEFGAWDGIHGSCTRKFIVEDGYSSVQIEADSERYARLKSNYADNPRVKTFNQFVGFTREDNLDLILKRTEIPRDFDLCIIDIDGNDYHVWRAMDLYRPKVVCIEFNPTIPPEVNFVQPSEPSISWGSSLAALVELGREKGYELVAVVSVNAYFVGSEYFPLYEVKDNRAQTLWRNRDCVTYFFTGYNGQVFLEGAQKLPWHLGHKFNASQVQLLPGFARTYPISKTRYNLFRFMANPLELLRAIRRRLTGRK